MLLRELGKNEEKRRNKKKKREKETVCSQAR